MSSIWTRCNYGPNFQANFSWSKTFFSHFTILSRFLRSRAQSSFVDSPFLCVHVSFLLRLKFPIWKIRLMQNSPAQISLTVVWIFSLRIFFSHFFRSPAFLLRLRSFDWFHQSLIFRADICNIRSDKTAMTRNILAQNRMNGKFNYEHDGRAHSLYVFCMRFRAQKTDIFSLFLVDQWRKEATP